MLGQAIALAAEKFKDKKDKGGVPYIMHCLTVMNRIRDLGEDAMQAAVLHDIIEDTDVTADCLLEMGFDPHVVDVILLLTHEEGESYDSYIRKISTSRIARTIKKADLRHNSDITRMKGLREKDFKRLEKYHRAFAYLNASSSGDL